MGRFEIFLSIWNSTNAVDLYYYILSDFTFINYAKIYTLIVINLLAPEFYI